jgi:pimeloyl-ACP methyl ester carboxylesterase
MSSARDNPGFPAPRRTRAGDVELGVVDVGHGMPVVLLHGFPLDHSMWGAQIAYLSRQWRVVAPDLRGFGKSDVTPGTVSMEQMAGDVAALLGALRLDEPVVLCGLSMGGYVAFEFWRKYRHHLKGLILCDTRAAADSPQAAAGRVETADRALREGTAPLAEAMLPKLFAPQTLASRPEIASPTREVILATAPAGAAAALLGMRERKDFSGALAEIAAPTLVVVGEHDAISPVAEMRSLAQSIPGAEFVIVPGAGHMAPVEDADGVNEAIEQFLTRVERS